MTPVLTIIFWAATWGVLLGLVLSPFVGAAADRYRRERREVERCGRIRYITDAPRFDGPQHPRPPRGRAA